MVSLRRFLELFGLLSSATSGNSGSNEDDLEVAEGVEVKVPASSFSFLELNGHQDDFRSALELPELVLSRIKSHD